MNTALWVLYSLFLLDADGKRYVYEGTNFSSKVECVQHTKTNLRKLTTDLYNRLDRLYGENSWGVLEIGCVNKNGDKNQRAPVVQVPWTIDEDGNIKIGEKLKGTLL